MFNYFIKKKYTIQLPENSSIILFVCFTFNTNNMSVCFVKHRFCEVPQSFKIWSKLQVKVPQAHDEGTRGEI